MNRLHQYSLASSVFLLKAGLASGQVVYTDIVPDTLIEDLDPGVTATFFDIDVDGDGSNDFRIKASMQTTSYGWGPTYYRSLVFEALPGRAVLGTYFADPLCTAAYIGPGAYFNSLGNQIAQSVGWFDAPGSDGSASRTSGGSGPIYLGFQFQIAAFQHYGWVRFTVNSGSSLTLDGYAYETTPGQAILAGQEPDLVVVDATDVSNFATAQDLAVTFSGVLDESTISEYRIIVVPDYLAGVFDLATAAGTTDYLAVNPTGLSIYDTTLLATSLDAFGNPILQTIDYRVFILTIGATIPDRLSAPSQVVTLSPIVTPPTSLVIQNAHPALATGTPADIQLEFETNDPLDVNEYRAILVPHPDVIDLLDASALAVDRYKVIAPPAAPSTINTNLDGLNKDYNGDSLVAGTLYRAYVLAATASGTAISELSDPSNVIPLNWGALPADDLELDDVADSGTPSDFEISFKGLENAVGISSYRAFIVPHLTTFEINLGLAAPPTNYMEFNLPGLGSPGALLTYTASVPGTTLDYLGNPILHNEDYDLVVLSVPAGDLIPTFERTYYPRDLTVDIDAAQSVAIFNSLENGDVTDITVDFDRAPDEGNIAAYRVFYVHEDSSFAIPKLIATLPASYVEITPDGSPNYSLDLPAGLLDADGASALLEVNYRAVVLSMFDGPAPEASVLEISPTKFKLFSPLPEMPVAIVEEVGDAGSALDALVSFIQPDETRVEEYRVYAVRQDLAGPTGLHVSDVAAQYINCFTLPPNGGIPGDTVEVNLTSNTRSLDGTYIGNGIPYKFFVLRQGGGFSLTMDPPVVAFTDPAMQVIPDRIEADGWFRQIFYFQEALKPNDVGAYKVFLRKTSSPLTQFLSQLDMLPPESTIIPEVLFGGEGSAILQSASHDIEGNPVVNGENYEVLVLTVGSGGPSLSNGFTLVETGMFFDLDTTASTTGLYTPATEELTVTLNGEILMVTLPPDIMTGKISILNMAGQLVMAPEVSTNGIVRLPGLSSGLYLALLRGDNGTIYKGRFTLQ